MASKPIAHGSRRRQVGWALALGICMTLFLTLSFHVNAIKSDVRLSERRIIALEQEKMMLETEFQTRASQRQLAEWNAVEFGYVAPRADQFLESERQLAMLGSPRGINAPEPIRVAKADPVPEEDGLIAEWVSPLTGQAIAAEMHGAAHVGDPVDMDRVELDAADLAQRLTRSTRIATVAEARQ